MVLSKKLLLLASAFLVACAAKFDPVEHGRLVEVRHHAAEALERSYCSVPEQAKHTAQKLDSDAGWLLFYSQYTPKNESMQTMSAELKKITHDFAQRYQQSTAPSRVFCELKLKNIVTVVDVMQRTNARRTR